MTARPHARRPCWRNVKLNFRSLPGDAEFGVGPQHLADFTIPTDGVLSLDFVSFLTPSEQCHDITVPGFTYLMDVLRQPLRAGGLPGGRGALARIAPVRHFIALSHELKICRRVHLCTVTTQFDAPYE